MSRLVSLPLSLVVVLASSVESHAATPEVAVEISTAMQNRDYDAAIAAIDRSLEDEKSPRDYLTYLKGRAYHYKKEYDKAIETFDAFARQFPDSPWARRVRFAKGLSQSRAGGFLSAEQVFRQEAEYLLSAERKQEIADIYIEFADSYFEPDKPLEKPDFDKALRFYQQAIEVGPLPKRKGEIELRIGHCLQQLGKHEEAAQLYTRFVEQNPDSELQVEARYRLGLSQLEQGRHSQARRTWQDLLSKYPESESPRIAEATYRLALTHGIPSPGDRENLELGIAALKRFVERYPEHELASKAHLQIGLSYQAFRRFEDASEAYKKFLADQRYADRDETPQARFQLGVSYQLQKRFDLALSTWKEYLTKHPADKQWSEAQQMIVNTEYLTAQERFAEKDYAVARNLWTTFLAEHPLDDRAPRIVYLMGHMNFDQEKWNEAIDDWRRVVSKYPGTDWAFKAQLMIGVTREEKLGQLEQALEEYKKVTGGSSHASAQLRIARLTSKHLTVSTEKVFRTDERPSVRLTTRNIEKVTIRAYRVDLETYFRKMHLTSGLEQLDIALIDPDRTFEFQVPDYSEFQQVECSVSLDAPKDAEGSEDGDENGDGSDPSDDRGGVLVVTVSGETLEATTVVLRSDLDVIVKSSRDEVFVFAENMLTGEPWAGVKLLISNGQQVFAEEVTGQDGVFKKSYEELKSPEDVRVFAVAQDNFASNVVSLQGLGVARGLAAKGYVYTDRPAYRPGQMVNLRAVIRKVADDVYQIDDGKKYHVRVLDTRNRLVWEEEKTLNEFGSLHSRFQLPADCTQGDYRIQVADDEKENYQGVFSVHQYQLDNVRLTIDSPRTVFYRGEKITGKIKADYYFGAPIVGKEIRYRLADGPYLTTTTDNDGELTFEFETREYRETQVLTLTVELPEQGVTARSNFILAARGFSLGLSTARPVFLAGESFEVTVKATDAEGKPTAEKLNVRVLERTTVGGRVGEREVQQHEVTTDAEEGEARLTLGLETGGTYVVRAEGFDRFENPITGEHSVTISGKDDDVRLRILADKHTYRAGDVATLKVHWRERPALALVTYQGARILHHELVRLDTGINELKVEMKPELAPNFELAIAVMTDPEGVEDSGAENGDSRPATCGRLHTADSPFSVQRDIVIKLERVGDDTDGPALPGEEIELKVTTTDPQDVGVAAEVGVAMIEQALLDRFASPTPTIGDFFRGAQREMAVRTTSSVTFAYQAQTRHINTRLLAEERRVDDLRMERAALSEVTAELDATIANQDFSRFAGGFANQLHSGAPGDAGAGGGQPSGGGSGIQQQAEQVLQSANQPFLAGGQQQGQQRMGRQLPADGTSFGDRAGDVVTWAMPRPAGDNQKWESHFGFGTVLRPAELSKGELADQIRRYAWSEQGNEVTALLANGVVRNYNLAQIEQDGDALLDELRQADAVVLPGTPSPETGYWNPAIVTDDSGQAIVAITLPERATSWKLLAKGVTRETLAGEAESAVVARKDLVGELKLPLAFTDGDQARLVATIQNDAVAEGQVDVELRATIGGRTATQSKSMRATEKGALEIVFETPIARPDDAGRDERVEAHFELLVKTGEHEDRFVRSVPINPYGVPVFATAGGTATGDSTAWVELPESMPTRSPQLEILIGPSIEQGLLDIVLGAAPRCQIVNQRLASGTDRAASDLMAAVSLQELLDRTRQADHPQATSLDSLIRTTVGTLVSTQQDDGGWSWTASGGSSDRYSTARVAWALTMAGEAGYKVPDETRQKAIAYLRDQVAKTANDDYESKAVLLHALSVTGQGDFPLANRLYRNRPSLSTAALVYLSLAFAEMDRAPIADELLRMVDQRRFDETDGRRRSAAGNLPCNHSPTELRALFAVAVQRVRSADPSVKESVDWLLSHRVGHRWSPDKATGPATLAATRWFATNRFAREHYQLSVWVNEKKVADLDFDKDSVTRTVQVPVELLKEGKQRINFQLTGRGRFSYQCVMEGFVAADRLTGTTKDWRVQRTYEPAPLERDGKPVPRGFDILRGSYSSFRNALTELPVGKRGQVSLHVWRNDISGDTPEEHLEYLVITEPIPNGSVVVEDSVSGGFDRYEITPGAIVFYVGNRRHVQEIRYDIQGFLPGEYRAAPTVVRDVYRPDRFATHEPKQLTVLPLGAESSDPYRLTPRELYELGKRHFQRKEMEDAARLLSQLVEQWDPRPETFQEVTRMLLDIHLEIGPAQRVVHHFEVIKEKWPDMVIGHEDILRIGRAYHDMGEYERCYLIYRATVESSFLAESRVAGFLQQQGELLRSVQVMNDLLTQYPPEPYVAAATFDLAQQVYATAPQAATDPRLREQKITRVHLIQRAIRMLDSFLTAHPNDPAADQASFSLAAALLELEQYSAAIDACRGYMRRYPDSREQDGYLYTVGYCHYALGDHQEALETCREVSEMKVRDRASGREVASPHRDRAIYILGQIHHSLGQAAQAIDQYARVKEQFADAKEAIEYFARREIRLSEVSTFEPGKPVEIELEFRNVADCLVKVYRIDLMKFGLLKRNLSGIADINLAGIRPDHEEAIELGDGKDYRDRTRKLSLPLEDVGAYLVVCRGDDLHASGLVVVSPYRIEVQEEASAGRVRTTIKDVTQDRYVSDVHVKVIGSDNSEFVSGETDLRGLMIADGIVGRSTVIARSSEGRYAFYRGTTHLGPQPQQEAAPAAPAGAEAANGQAQPGKAGELLEGLYRRNFDIQMDNSTRQQQLYFNDSKGVKAEAVK